MKLVRIYEADGVVQIQHMSKDGLNLIEYVMADLTKTQRIAIRLEEAYLHLGNSKEYNDRQLDKTDS